MGLHTGLWEVKIQLKLLGIMLIKFTKSGKIQVVKMVGKSLPSLRGYFCYFYSHSRLSSCNADLQETSRTRKAPAQQATRISNCRSAEFQAKGKFLI